jgi:DNA-binding Lrp family transcriptional regulator
MAGLRVAGRLANAFVLDLVKLGGHRRDVADALVRAAVVHANLAHLIRDGELQTRYAGLDQDPPDELRRPASINAIATSLSLPFETVRRRVGGLAEAGICAVTSKGVIVPQAATSSPPYRAALQFQYEKLQALYERLRAIDVLRPPQAPAPWRGDPPVRLVGRLVVEFVLRFTEPVLEQVPDPVTTLTLLEVILANTEGLPDHEGGEEGTEVSAFVPDWRRAPVSVSALRTRLGIPNETLRRHVSRLCEAGLCRPVERGYIVPADALSRPELLAFMLRNHANLTRMFAGLGHAGVLATWEQTGTGNGLGEAAGG